MKKNRSMDSLINFDSELLDEFTDLEELKHNYRVLKAQRDGYKLLLSRYEKIFLKDYLKKDKSSIEIVSEKQILNISPDKPKDFTLVWENFDDKNAKSAQENKTTTEGDTDRFLDEKEGQNNFNISEKIELLGKEINALKNVLEEKNEIFHKTSEDFQKKNEFMNSSNMNELVNSSNMILNEMNLKKYASTMNVFANSNRKLSIDKRILDKNRSSSADVKENLCEDLNNSVDDASGQIQDFFKNMVNQLKFSEEKNFTLSSQLQDVLKEKESLQKNTEDLKNELNKLNDELEEKKREKYLNGIENLLDEEEINLSKKNNICKNLCNLI